LGGEEKRRKVAHFVLTAFYSHRLEAGPREKEGKGKRGTGPPNPRGPYDREGGGKSLGIWKEGRKWEARGVVKAPLRRPF